MTRAAFYKRQKKRLEFIYEYIMRDSPEYCEPLTVRRRLNKLARASSHPSLEELRKALPAVNYAPHIVLMRVWCLAIAWALDFNLYYGLKGA